MLSDIRIVYKADYTRWVQYYVYILRCADGTLYTGKTNDIKRRLRQHNGELAGGAKYTSGRGPGVIVYTQTFETIGEALKRESEIKSLSKKEKEALLA